MAIVQNFTNFFTPDVFLREVAPAPTITGASIGVIGMLIQSTRGLVNTSTLCSNMSDFILKFGPYDKTVNKGWMAVRNAFLNGATTIKVVRVTDGTDLAATGVVSGSTFTLNSTGTWGNNVTLTVNQNAASGYVDLLFANGAEIYSYPQVTFATATDARYVGTVLQLTSDNFVTISVIGASNPTTGTITFTGGSNGTLVEDALTDSAYIGGNGVSGLTGLSALEADDQVELVCTHRNTVAMNNALIAHVNLATVTPRMAIIAPAFGSQVSDVVTLMQTVNSDRVVMTYPNLQILNPYNGKKEYHSPVAFYAGLLSTLSYEQSPSRRQITGILGTERALTRADVDTLSKNRVSSITLLNGQGFVVRNGFNTSSVPSQANITRRRAVNYFAKTFEIGSQQFVSKPHTVKLRQGVVSAFGQILDSEVRLGRIGNVNGGAPYAVRCDSTNNPDSTVRQNKLIVDVQISLLAPADFILITLDASEANVISI